MKVNIIILNYNGEHLLKECLPSIIEAAHNSRFNCCVSVIDNKSTDGSIEYIEAEYPEITVYKAKRNQFLVSYNDFIANLDDDIVILLNNDIKTDKDFVDPLIEVFLEKKDAFMVGPKCWTFDKQRYEGSLSKIRFYFGYMQSFARYPGYHKNINVFSYSAAVGSVVAFDRKKFLELGGFDAMYLPGRVEDLDICYRGWKYGWKGYYQPKSLAFHKSSAAFKDRFSYEGLYRLTYKNTFLFIWKNITDSSLILQHLLFLLPRLIYSLITLKVSFFIGFIEAVPYLPQALKRRKKEKKRFILSDKEIFYYVGF